MTVSPKKYITLNGMNYAVESGSYMRAWIRQFTMNITAAVIQLNFVDSGPGLRTYTMNLLINDWTDTPLAPDIPQTIDQQVTNLESAYGLRSTALGFTDPNGDIPSQGVYFTKLTQTISQWSTKQKPYIIYQIELVEAGKNTP